jgi:hypothetical protein
MSKDTRTVLDAVRTKVPPNAKMLVCWIGADGFLHASHANMNQADLVRVADSLHASSMTMPGGLVRAA